MPMVGTCVVGGGIVGLATARGLQRAHPGASVLVLEKGESLAGHQTGHNSGVIHAGIYYQPGSLKARLCREGADWTKQFCVEQGIQFRQTGKLIVATEKSELGRLEDLRRRAEANRIEVESWSGADLAEREPNVRGLAAVFSPATAVVNYSEICAALATQVRDHGGEVR